MPTQQETDNTTIVEALYFYKRAFNSNGWARIDGVIQRFVATNPPKPVQQYPELKWSKPEYELHAEINRLKKILRDQYGFINIPKEIA